MLELGIAGVLLVALVGSASAAIHFARLAAKEKARADDVGAALEVVKAMADPVAPAKNLEELKARAKKRRDRSARLRSARSK